ncbi:MAG: hypothetical protein QME51_08660, partial [Planctomycetota bacterium]|nr:hypothetical protein [Planctomycetota bacterium]
MPKVIDKEKTLIALEKYIKTTDIPILAEFCYRNYISDDFLQDHPQVFGGAIKNLKMKKQTKLERYALEGKIEKTMAIFSLKQMGWRDNHEARQDINIKIDWGTILSDYAKATKDGQRNIGSKVNNKTTN